MEIFSFNSAAPPASNTTQSNYSQKSLRYVFLWRKLLVAAALINGVGEFSQSTIYNKTSKRQESCNFKPFGLTTNRLNPGKGKKTAWSLQVTLEYCIPFAA
jgi:hypothetical protein